MKTCTHCKTENNDSANFCRQCGFVFPGFKAKDGKTDISLAEKVNELQKKVTESEREVSTLNSKVSSLVSDRSNLQSQLSQTRSQLTTASNSLNAEKKKAADAQKQADEAKKEKEEVESSKGVLHLLYIVVIVIVGIIAIVQYNGKNDALSENYSLNSKVEELKGKVNNLKSQNSKLTIANKSMSSVLEKIGSKTPLFIGDVSIRNSGDSYGQTIYDYSNTYINPKVEIFSLIDGRVDIYVKLYTPYGMSTGSSSPSGYSYSDYFYLTKNSNNTCEFKGWGGSDRGHWNSGSYRFEFYYQGKCIGSKSFTIY